MDIIICSGPVIIENQRVLLIKERKRNEITPWFFPGGKVESNESYEDACIREAKEETGLDVKILKQLQTLEDTVDNVKIQLVHFLAKRKGEVKPGPTVCEWAWHDINNLP
ncbi:MAG: NUDIX hydrolase, partial [bacterium]